MIVRDEQDVLGRCLASLVPHVNEVCLIDTGSKDRTVQIAESFGCKIGHFEWCDDFAAARNESLKLATCDWIWQVDADDVVIGELVPEVKAFLSNTDADLCEYFTYEVTSEGAGWSPEPVARLFRNRAGFYYRGRVHEVPCCDWHTDRAVIVHRFNLCLVRHDGGTAERLTRKGDRNIRLLRMALQDDQPPGEREFFEQKLAAELAWRNPH
jgi:glycosyltransferase involved in cell wall biosynthesis